MTQGMCGLYENTRSCSAGHWGPFLFATYCRFIICSQKSIIRVPTQMFIVRQGFFLHLFFPLLFHKTLLRNLQYFCPTHAQYILCYPDQQMHNIYRVSQEECARIREGVPYVKVYRYNPKHLQPKLNGCETSASSSGYLIHLFC